MWFLINLLRLVRYQSYWFVVGYFIRAQRRAVTIRHRLIANNELQTRSNEQYDYEKAGAIPLYDLVRHCE